MARRSRFLIAPVPLTGREIACYALLSSVLAAVPFLIFFPGLWTNDSIGRWHNAYILVTKAELWRPWLSDWFPPLMGFVMAATLKFTGTVWTFTLLQYWFVIAGAMAGGHALGGHWRSGALIGTLVAFLPGVFDNAALVMPDPWTAGALAMSVSGLVVEPRGRFATAVFRLVLFAADMVLLGFRANSLPLVPVLLAVALVSIESRGRRNWYCGLLCAALIADLAVEHLPLIRHVDVTAPILLWEVTCMLKVLDDPALTRQFALPEVGDMSAAVAATDFWVQDKLYWWPGHPFTPKDALDHGASIRAAWWSLVTSHPLAYLEAKLHIWSWLAGFHGVDRPFVFVTQESDSNQTVQALLWPEGVAPDDHRLGPLETWIDRISHHVPDVFYSPWQAAAVACCAAGVNFGLGTRWRLAGLMIGMGTWYYAAFFVLSPGFHFRYFFPSYFIFAILVVATVLEIIRRGLGAVRPVRRRRS